MGRPRVGFSEGANWNQENWGWVHAGIFLGELHHSSPDEAVAALLQRIVDALQENQETSGGFAHGPGGPNALGYVELNIMAGYVLGGLGLAQQAGCQIETKVVDRLLEYLQASSNGGGVGYSTKSGQKGQGNIGSTAGVPR